MDIIVESIITKKPDNILRGIMVDSCKYKRVMAIDHENRYIDMKEWGIQDPVAWIETYPIQMDMYLLVDTIDK